MADVTELYPPRRRMASALTKRLVVLLRESEDPVYEMHEAARRLEEEGLFDGEVPAKPKAAQFAARLIEDNPLVEERLMLMDGILQPAGMETVGDLVSYLLPGDSF